MQRVDVLLPILRLSEHGHFFLSAALVLITLVVVRYWFRHLLYLWCLCTAGLIMIHQQLITGLQMQNSHWANLFCACMMLLLALLVIDIVGRTDMWGRVAGKILLVAIVFNAAAGVYLRGLEAVQTRDSRHYSRTYQRYENQRRLLGSAWPAPDATTAGDEDFVEFAIIVNHVTPLSATYPVIWSSGVSNLDFDRRIALNAYLCGFSREQFEANERLELDHLQNGVEKRNLAMRVARLASRLAFFDQVTSSPSAAIDHYAVRYLALPAGTVRPTALGSDWFLLQNGPTWQVWERHGAG